MIYIIFTILLILITYVFLKYMGYFHKVTIYDGFLKEMRVIYIEYYGNIY
jgi:hypothetical protein